jgi:hypothetical protein
MNYRLLFAATMLLMPVSAKSQSNPRVAGTSDVDIAPYDRSVLKDLRNLNIVIQAGKPEAKLGIDANLLGSLVFVTIKRDVPSIKLSNDHPQDNEFNQPLLGFMYVEVSCVANVNISGCRLEITVERAVRLLSEDGTRYVGDIQMVKVWSKEAMFVGGACPMHKQIEDSVSEMLTRFAADYYRQNPSSR